MNTTTLLQEQSALPLLAIIDADSIPWMIGGHHREHEDIPTVKAAVDTWMQEFRTINGFTHCIGVLSNSSGTCFERS